MQERIEIVQATDQSQRLDIFWQAILDEEGVPRARIQSWIRAGRSRINGQVCTKPSTRIITGQVLSLQPECLESELVPDSTPLAVVYADSHLVVVNKEAGLTVHPAPSVSESTLVHRVLYSFPVLRDQKGDRPGIVHRLDKETSGLIVLALSNPAQQTLTEAFASREIYKEYLALAAGVPSESGRITLALGRHPTIKTRMAVLECGGRDAETLYQTLWSAPDNSASLLRVSILTGRTHQIRVHLAALGHPLLGDPVYADKRTTSRAPRQMLHAWRLGLDHPVTGEKLKFSCPPPDDFLDILCNLSQRPVRIGLTGVAGSGKTSVARAVEALGIPVFCADRAVAKLYAPGQDGAVILEHHLGRKFLDDQGGVDRQALFKAMSESAFLRQEVERLIHPLVIEAMEHFFAAQKTEVLCADIPLLFESNMTDLFDMVAVVFCPEKKRRAHLAQRRWSDDHVEQVDAWQWSQEQKVRRASLVLDNSASLEELQVKTQAVLHFAQSWNHARMTKHMNELLKMFDSNTFDELTIDHVSPPR